jgi:DNA topoisomerase-6 subunit B
MIHVASVWVPFTSESKEAIADYDEIRKEMRLALMECGRKLGTYLRKRQRMRREGERRDIFERYIGEVAKALNSINGVDPRKVHDALLKQARERTAVADQVLDEDGKVVKDEPIDEEGVIIVPEASTAALDAADAVASAAAEPRIASAADSPRPRSAKAPASAAKASAKGAAPRASGRGRGAASAEPGLF